MEVIAVGELWSRLAGADRPLPLLVREAAAPRTPLIPGSLVVGPGDLEVLDQVLRRDEPLVVHGVTRDCGTSRRVAQRLDQVGFVSVTWLEGGLEGWVAAGLPVE